MKTLIAAAALSATLLFAGSPAFAQTAPSADQCTAWLAKVDKNGDGVIAKDEDGRRYLDMITKASGQSDGEDDSVKSDMFLAECGKGTFGMPAE